MTIDRSARIIDLLTWGDYHLQVIASPGVARDARPGQFVMVKASADPYPLLRRPLSLHDAGNGRIALFFKIAGRGTRALAGRRVGENLDILGPLGRGFSVSDGLAGKRALLVGGGRGIAPLYFLGRELLKRRAEVVVLYGGKCVEDIPLRERFEAAGLPLLCSTDDGTFGFRGLVTELLGEELGRKPVDHLFVCGPDAMMKAVAAAARAAGVPAEFSLEALMGCGIGACWGCVRRIRNESGDGWVKICEEGPVFSGERIVWTE
jgi:dihydroorotate dehydrogenase electron transfer subunit